jgi:beta-glucosidase
MHQAVSQLTLEEKAALLSGAGFWNTVSVPRAGIQGAVLTDGPHGVRYQPAESDHLGVNQSVSATAFPTAAATGSSWDPALLERMGAALGAESRSLGVDVLLGPGVNIKRSPLGGRNFEYFSEDPLLSGVLGAAWVSGIQGMGVGASVKHFAANNQETERMRVSSDVDERTLREIFFPAFERIVTQARPATIMCSYNRINGVFASENSWLLTDVLRDDWGFDGYVVSDWGAVNDAVAAVAAGTDLAMPATAGHADAVVAAVRSGRLDEAIVDASVSRILEVHDRLRVDRDDIDPVDPAALHELACEIAVESSVLLTNDGLLPLDPGVGGRIAVVGEFARTPRFQGAGSSHISPTQLDSAIEALSAATRRDLVFAAGFRLDGQIDAALADEAVAAAAEADVVLFFAGLPDDEESEGFDRTHLRLPTVQVELLRRVAVANPRVAVVLSNGAVVDVRPLMADAAAILEAWLGGQAGGTAVARIVFGECEPGGRLAETIPLEIEHTPAFANWPGTRKSVLYGERIYVGYRWYDATRREVAFPFGFGLGYTSFTLTDVRVSVPDARIAQAVVEVTVSNTGERAGSEVVQVYVGGLDASVDRPERELKAFEKVRLQPGERRRLRLVLDERAFAYWGDSGWTVEPGRFRVEVGTSSRHIHAQEVFTLDVPRVDVVLDGASTVADWLSHSTGSVIVEQYFAASDDAATSFMMNDPGTRRIIGSMPLRTLLEFGGRGDASEVIEELLSRA